MSTSTPDPGIASLLAQGVIACYANDPSQLPSGFSQSAASIYVAEYSFLSRKYDQVPFGFAATNGSMNIIVMRGTANAYEALVDTSSWGTNCPCSFPPGSTPVFGNVNQGLYQLYTTGGNGVDSLSASTLAALQTLPDPSLPLYIAGHSLGGPMTTFAALDVHTNAPEYASTLQLYTFASLHVGDQDFANAFNQTNIVCYRFANLCDFVPSLTGITADTTNDPYVHVGLPCTFVWQTWEDWGNHSMANIYQPTIDNHWSVIQFGNLNYPASVAQ